MRHHELPFTGPATFFKAPHRPEAGRGEAHIGLLGVPYDFGVGFRPGARFGPAALRAASGRYAPPPEGFFDLDTGRMRLAGARIVDLGDVDPAQLETQVSFDRITSAARRLRTIARMPVFVGGDHSLTYPVLRAYDDVPELHVVQLDAHLDFSESRNATRFANSSPFRRAVEAVPGLRRVTTIGLRGLRTDREAVEAARARGHGLITCRTVRDEPEVVLEALPERAAVYLSVDIDVLDPAIAPGTGSPEVDGLSYGEVITIVAATLSRNRLVGMDLVEVAPELDPSGQTALVGARLLAETMALWWEPGGLP
jgi:agmatinase